MDPSGTQIDERVDVDVGRYMKYVVK